MLQRLSRPAVIKEDLPDAGRADALAALEPDDSPRDHALDQVDAMLAGALEE